ncbi:MAG: tryptophan-rich sensory protein [Candidatus Abyssubacteria bacterium]
MRTVKESKLVNSRILLGLLGWFGLTFLAAWIGSQFSPGDWYTQLAKPSWTPPAWVFAPVWTLLYVLMAIGAWLVWKRGGVLAARLPLALFVVQLALNAAWSWLFFGLKMPGVAFGELLLLLSFIVATTALFMREHIMAGILMVPYVLWVCFAAALNYSIWRMNS